MKKKSILIGSLVAGAMITAGSSQASTPDPFNFSTLGSGAEVRAGLLDNGTQGLDRMLFEMKCGTEGTEAKKDESKSKEMKCGEGKCGEGEKTVKKDDDTKTSEARTEKKDEATKESKSKEMKCGEGKCGVE